MHLYYYFSWILLLFSHILKTTTTVSSKIIVIGGLSFNGSIDEKSVEMYDMETKKWSRLADLAYPRHAQGVVALDGRVYAIGGGRLGNRSGTEEDSRRTSEV